MCITRKRYETASEAHTLCIQHPVRRAPVGLNALDKVSHIAWRLYTCKRYDRLYIESVAQIDHFTVDTYEMQSALHLDACAELKSYIEDRRTITCQPASRTMVPSRPATCSPSAPRLSVGTLAAPSIFAIRSSSRLQVCRHCDPSQCRTHSYLLHTTWKRRSLCCFMVDTTSKSESTMRCHDLTALPDDFRPHLLQYVSACLKHWQRLTAFVMKAAPRARHQNDKVNSDGAAQKPEFQATSTLDAGVASRWKALVRAAAHREVTFTRGTSGSLIRREIEAELAPLCGVRPIDYKLLSSKSAEIVAFEGYF